MQVRAMVESQITEIAVQEMGNIYLKKKGADFSLCKDKKKQKKEGLGESRSSIDPVDWPAIGVQSGIKIASRRRTCQIFAASQC